VDEAAALFKIKARNRQTVGDREGCQRAGGRLAGTYLHGLFDSPDITRKWLECWGLHNTVVNATNGPDARDRAYDQLAAHMAQYLDLEAIRRLIPNL
jgi:adenosylcobyric acid synthase